MIGKTRRVKEARKPGASRSMTSCVPKEGSTTTRETGAIDAPFMKGHAQFRKLRTARESHAANELIMRNAATLPTNGTRMLDTKIKESEYPGWSDLEK